MIRLVAATTGVGELAGKSAEEVVTFAARVSNPANQTDFASGPKLLAYCIRNEHWSVFETAGLTFEVTTSRAIAEQLTRHRSFTFQMKSQRYSGSHGNTENEARRQDSKNRQNSVDDLSNETRLWFKEAQAKVWNTSHSLYSEALVMGIAKECARFLLPLSTETTLYMTGSMRSWYHYCQLRRAHGTQKEHADIAEAIRKEIAINFKTFALAFGWFDES